MLANRDGGRCGSPPTAACALLRGPLCSCPHLTPSHPICCPKSQMGIKRSAKPSTGRRLQKKLRLTLKTNISDNLHTPRNICLFSSPPAPPVHSAPGIVPGPGHMSHPGGIGHPAGGEQPWLLARRQPGAAIGHGLGKTGSFAVTVRSWAQSRLTASLPSSRGRQGSSLPAPRLFFP